jgi:uncharacterized protein DUF5916/cellulose/xylan binding protein with CBM9 domain
MLRSGARRLAIALTLTLAAMSRAWAQSPPPPGPPPGDLHSMAISPLGRAALRTGPIVVDGRLDDSAWAAATPVTDFRQSQPHEGEPATQRTEVRFLFDDDALYIGARMFDTEGAAGVRSRLVRRDQSSNADYLEVIFDTFHDHLGRAFFSINPAGTKGDAYGPNGADLDDSWDPVWEVEARIDSLGWTAEFRIPLAQLRYPRDTTQTWGLQVWRMESRLNELSQWSFWRLNEPGGPPRFGHLEGLHITRGPERAELLPYVLARSTNDPSVSSGDPFHDPHVADAQVGADFRYLLGTNLTVSGTVNPDFGQVEVDPAVVNLSAFETYYPEHRPFFVEGSGLFDFGWFNCFFCSNVSSMNLFYSRRIGRAPQGSGNAYNAGSWTDVPQYTRILGAAKLTGRAASRWNISALEAVTAREHARVQDSLGQRFNVEVEPLTNYFVGRLARDLPNGSFVRGMVTSVVRDLSDSSLRTQLNVHSEAAGLETSLWWHRRTYRFMGHVALTDISGDSSAILRAQQSSARYFQRPDRGNGSNGLFSDRYDPSLTSMRGYGGYARVGKQSGDWLWELSTNIRSPGFEANDVAFNSQADRIWMNGNVLRQYTHPTRIARYMTFIAGGQQAFNYDGDLVDRQAQVFAAFTFLNYWEFNTFYMVRPERLDDQLTRGGPVLERAAQHFIQANISTDGRKNVVLGFFPSYSCRDGVCSWSTGLSATLHPLSNVQLELGPNYADSKTRAQYVTAKADPTATAMYGSRYVFADLHQRELGMDTRLNVTFTPTLTLEVFAQLLVSSGAYTSYKEYDRPRSLDRSIYGVDVGTITQTGSRFVVDPDGAGPADTLSFADPNFNFRSLRGNAVMRWEFRPGSTLYLVWTQSRSDQQTVSDFNLDRDLGALRATQPENIFLVKVSYWIGL